MNNLIVTFDTSNEDVPTLVVGKESFALFTGPGIDIINIITGEKALAIKDILLGNTKKFEVITFADKEKNNESKISDVG